MKKHRILAWALATSMAFTSFPANTFAQDEDTANTETGFQVLDENTSGSGANTGGNTSGGSGSGTTTETTTETTTAETPSGGDEVAQGDWKSGDTGKTMTQKYEATVSNGSYNLKTIENGAGKFSGGEDSIIYFANEMQANQNFTLSAKVKVNAFNTLGSSNPHQSSFGIGILNNLWSKNNSDSETYDSGVYAGFYAAKSTDTAGTISAADRLGADASKKTIAKPELKDGVAITGTDIGEYELSIEKNGKNYKISCGGQTVTVEDKYGMMKDTIYPVLYIARDADVTFSDVKIEVNNKVVTGIKADTTNAQKEYYVGEKFNPEGLSVEVEYADGKSEKVDVKDLAITGFDSTTVGTKTISIASGDVSTTFDVTVRAKKVTDIQLVNAPVLNVYNVGQLFNPSGASVTATYEDGMKVTLKSDEIAYSINGTPVDKTTAITADMVGNQVVTVAHAQTENVDPNGVSATYDVTVNNSQLSKIFVAVEPAKTVYYIGDEFDQTGLVVRGSYSDGTQANLQDTEYTVTGFDSSAVSNEVPVTVTYNADPNLTATFNVKVLDLKPLGLKVTTYPRTTYTVGEDFDLTGMEVVTRYNNGSTTPVVEGTDYTVDLSEFNANKNSVGTTTVYIVPTNSAFAKVPVEVTIREASKQYWRGAIFGQSSGGTSVSADVESALTGGNSSIDADNYGTVDGKITVRSWFGSGKITGDHDGIAYYYTTVPNEDNFTLTADVYVRGYLGANSGPYNVDEKRSGQEAFGIMARDVIPLKASDGSGVTVDVNAADKDADGVPVALNKGAVFSSNMAIAGGYSGNSWPADTTAASYEKNANINRINLVARTGVTNFTAGKGTKLGPNAVSSTFPKAGIAGEGANLSGVAAEETQKGDTYRITLKRINVDKDEATGTYVRGLQATATNLETNETMTTYLDDATVNDMFTTQNDQVYVGFFASRWAVIDVTNADLKLSDPATDPVIATYVEEPKSVNVTVSSNLYTTETDYTLVVKVNNKNGGYLTVSQNGNVVYRDQRVASSRTSLPLTLVPNTTNVIQLVYTPSKADNLVSYSDVIRTVNIVHKDNIDKTSDMYVAPNGTTTGNGTKEDPLDLNTALGYIRDGQKIIMLDGVYESPETIDISESMTGIKDTRYLVADEGANPVIDFMGKGSGFKLTADNWYIKGITFTRSADQQSGFGLGGKYCTVENCTFVNNGGTGMQISRNSSTQVLFDSWPAYNLVLNCETYNNADSSKINADGFAAKLTVGNGNVFKGCVSHHNVDDGWDLYTKIGSGAIGPVVLEDCISYKQGFELMPDGTDKSYGAGGHNGFKMGGENVAVKHYLKDCKTFMNDPDQGSGSGVSSNSNPNMKIRNVIAYDNYNAGINLYSDAPEKYDYDLKGVVSLNNGSTDKVGSYLNKDEDIDTECKKALATEESNYFQRDENGTTNINGEKVTADFFKSVDADAVLKNGRFERNADGTWNTGDFLERKVAYVHAEEDLVKLPGVGGISSNGYGDKVETTESTETTTRRSTGHSGGSSGGGSSSSSSSSKNNTTTTDKNNNATTDKDNTNNATTDTSNTNNTNSDSSSANASTTKSYPSFTVSGVKVTVPRVDKSVKVNFKDTASRSWATSSIEKLAAAGIINGVNKDNFAPDENSKRADFVVMLVRTLGVEGQAKDNFADVDSSKYYANALGLAKEFGITSGIGNNNFDPEGTISRQDMMVLTARTLDMLGVKLDTNEDSLSDFADNSNIASYARPYVAALVNANIVSGTGDSLEATALITRAQVAVIMSKVYDMVTEIAENNAKAEETAETEKTVETEEVAEEVTEA